MVRLACAASDGSSEGLTTYASCRCHDSGPCKGLGARALDPGSRVLASLWTLDPGSGPSL
eukprot:993146-Prymnesium_polylepis.1